MKSNSGKKLKIIALLLLPICFTFLFKLSEAFGFINKASKGPNNGILRSAGKFKTELTMGNYIEVYLLDQNSSEASVSQSSIRGQIYFNQGTTHEREYNLHFWANKRRKKFVAYWPKPINSTKARRAKPFSIVLLPTRKKITGIPVVYKMNQTKSKGRKNAASHTNN